MSRSRLLSNGCSKESVHDSFCHRNRRKFFGVGALGVAATAASASAVGALEPLTLAMVRASRLPRRQIDVSCLWPALVRASAPAALGCLVCDGCRFPRRRPRHKRNLVTSTPACPPCSNPSSGPPCRRLLAHRPQGPPPVTAHPPPQLSGENQPRAPSADLAHGLESELPAPSPPLRRRHRCLRRRRRRRHCPPLPDTAGVRQVLGNVRYFLETIRPEIRQYFVESDREALPFSRLERSAVYQRAKGQPDTLPFGTRHDVYETGYEWVAHSTLSPCHVDPAARGSCGPPARLPPRRPPDTLTRVRRAGGLTSRAQRRLVLCRPRPSLRWPACS